MFPDTAAWITLELKDKLTFRNMLHPHSGCNVLRTDCPQLPGLTASGDLLPPCQASQKKKNVAEQGSALPGRITQLQSPVNRKLQGVAAFAAVGL